MRKIALLSFFFFSMSVVGYSQQNDADSYETEFIWGINKNTAGGFIGGFVIRSSKRINDRLYQSIGVELMNVKHPQEVRVRSGTGNFFIYGKSNYLYALRAQYGRELIVFKKASQQGVEIKAVVAAGPSIGILAPYYIDYNADGGNTGINSRKEQYDPDRHSFPKILGTGHVLQGIQESQFRIGGNVKAALSFELGTLKSHVTGFEAGFLLDAYAGDIPLLPTAKNKSVFPTAFITLFYGKRR